MNTELRSVFASDFSLVDDEGKLNVTLSGVLVEFSLADGLSGGSFRIESFIVLLPAVVVVEVIAGKVIVLEALVVRVAEALFATLSDVSAPVLEMNGDVTLQIAFRKAPSRLLALFSSRMCSSIE